MQKQAVVVAEKKMDGLKEMAAIEAQVHEKVVDKLQQDIDTLKKQLREMATILKIPRLHHKYLREHGVNEFIDKCKEVVEYHDKLEEEYEYSQRRLKARIRDSIERSEEHSPDYYKPA